MNENAINPALRIAAHVPPHSAKAELCFSMPCGTPEPK